LIIETVPVSVQANIDALKGNGMARPSLGKSSTVRLHVKMTEEESNAIEEWRQANGIQSVSEAVRLLCAKALSGTTST
jgi:hypothetical protein